MKPGEEIIAKGIDDLRAGVESMPALLVSIGASRLRRAGVPVPAKTFDDPEHRLYRMLAAENEDSAHSRYNALIRLLVSFERAVESNLFRYAEIDPPSFQKAVRSFVHPVKK
ncbi:MAG: hypothetical protein AB7Q37_10360 [Pyrinomonadaceae bacterium]